MSNSSEFTEYSVKSQLSVGIQCQIAAHTSNTVSNRSTHPEYSGKSQVWQYSGKSHFGRSNTVANSIYLILKNLDLDFSESSSETWLCGDCGSHVSWWKSRVWHTASISVTRAFRWYQGQVGVHSADFDLPMCHDGFWPILTTCRSFNLLRPSLTFVLP